MAEAPDPLTPSANMHQLISSYEMLQESFRAKSQATEQMRALHEEKVAEYKTVLEEKGREISSLERSLDEERYQTRLARKDLSIALGVIAKLEYTKVQPAADDNHSFRVSDDSETHGVKILIDLGAEKKAREFVQRAMYLQEQSQLEEKSSPLHTPALAASRSPPSNSSETQLNDSIRARTEKLKADASSSTENNGDDESSAHHHHHGTLPTASAKKSFQTQTENMADEMTSSRPNNSSDSHVSPTLHRQKAALDRLERENGDLKQRLESSQADEQARRKDLIESESVAEGAMADLERTKKRLEEYLDEKARALNHLKDAIHQRDAILAENEELKRKVDGLTRENHQLQEQLEEKDDKIADLSKGVEPFIVRENELRSRYDAEVIVRRKLYQSLMDLKGNVRVIGSEKSEGVGISFPYDNEVRVQQGMTDASTRFHDFELDAVFRPRRSQEDVYNEIHPFIQSVIEGKSVCILAYGQTGSGKTHTMEGTSSDPGMSPRALDDLFIQVDRIDKNNFTTQITCSVLEVYNEQIRDLLAPEDIERSPRSRLATEGQQQQQQQGSEVHWAPVNSKEDIRELLRRAQSKRVTAATNSNTRSSRSHMVVEVRVCQESKLDRQKTVSVLNLVDLAGSERVSVSGSIGERLKEAQAINKSLSALGDVINAIKNKQQHKPFRNSKLTWVLKNSMDGSSKIVMIVNLNPCKSSAGESIASLHFAERVRSTELNAQAQRSGEARTPKKQSPASSPFSPRASPKAASPNFKLKVRPSGIAAAAEGRK